MKSFNKALLIGCLLSTAAVAGDVEQVDVTVKTGNEFGNSINGAKVELHGWEGDIDDYYAKFEYEHVADDDFEAEVALGFGNQKYKQFDEGQIYGYINYQKDQVDFANVSNLSVGVAYDLSQDMGDDIDFTHGIRLGLVGGDACGLETGVYGRLKKKLNSVVHTYGKAEFNYKGGEGSCAEFMKASVEAGLIFEIGERFYVKTSVALEGSDLNDIVVYEDRHEFLGIHTGSDYYYIEQDISSDIEPRYEAEFGFRF